MSRVFKVGMLHEKITKNPVLHVQTRCKFDYRAIVMSPQQTLAIMNSLPAVLRHTLVLTCAATALRSSEILALRWADMRWEEQRIRVSKRWADGKDGVSALCWGLSLNNLSRR
jgi:integrase